MLQMPEPHVEGKIHWGYAPVRFWRFADAKTYASLRKNVCFRRKCVCCPRSLYVFEEKCMFSIRILYVFSKTHAFFSEISMLFWRTVIFLLQKRSLPRKHYIFRRENTRSPARQCTSIGIDLGAPTGLSRRCQYSHMFDGQEPPFSPFPTGLAKSRSKKKNGGYGRLPGRFWELPGGFWRDSRGRLRPPLTPAQAGMYT